MTDASTEPNAQDQERSIPSPQDLAERASNALENANALQQQAKERLEHANHTAITFIQDQPLLALGVAFGVGYLLGAAAKRRWII